MKKSVLYASNFRQKTAYHHPHSQNWYFCTLNVLNIFLQDTTLFLEIIRKSWKKSGIFYMMVYGISVRYYPHTITSHKCMSQILVLTPSNNNVPETPDKQLFSVKFPPVKLMVLLSPGPCINMKHTQYQELIVFYKYLLLCVFLKLGWT